MRSCKSFKLEDGNYLNVDISDERKIFLVIEEDGWVTQLTEREVANERIKTPVSCNECPLGVYGVYCLNRIVTR